MSRTSPTASPPQEPWYRYGFAVLCLEMLIAVAVSAYALYRSVHGLGVP